MHPRRLEQRILKGMNLANRQFGLLNEGDRILVAMSGGKDSYGLLWGLRKMQAAAPYKFDLVAFHLDQAQPGHNPQPLADFLATTGVPFEVEKQDTYSRVMEMTEPGKTYCAVCARFRRAIIYKAARRHGCNKVALGHHREDLLITLLLNLFFTGQIKSMPAKLINDDGDQRVIRPLCLVPESELIELAQQQGFPILPCSLCGNQDHERKAMNRLLEELSERYPRIRTSMLAALGRVRTSHLLDPSLNDLYTSSHAREMLVAKSAEGRGDGHEGGLGDGHEDSLVGATDVDTSADASERRAAGAAEQTASRNLGHDGDADDDDCALLQLVLPQQSR